MTPMQRYGLFLLLDSMHDLGFLNATDSIAERGFLKHNDSIPADGLLKFADSIIEFGFFGLTDSINKTGLIFKHDSPRCRLRKGRTMRNSNFGVTRRDICVESSDPHAPQFPPHMSPDTPLSLVLRHTVAP